MTGTLDSAEQAEQEIQARHDAKQRRRRQWLVFVLLACGGLSFASSGLLLVLNADSTIAHVVGYLSAALVATSMLALAARLVPHHMERRAPGVWLAVANVAACALAIAHALTLTRRWW